MTDETAPKLSATETYRNWLSAEPTIKAAMKAAVSGYEIPSIDVRIENFVKQLGHEMREAAHEEAFAPPKPKD
jgi:hypothetical protein